MKLKINSYLILLISLPSITFSQVEMSVFNATGRAGVSTTFATDYQCLGINPANLGSLGFSLNKANVSSFGGSSEQKKNEEKSFSFSMGLLELGLSAYSDALKKKELKKTIFKAGGESNLTKEEKYEAALQFADAGFAVNFDINHFGMALQFAKVGGFGINIREHLVSNIKLNSTAADIMFNGYNATYFDTIQLLNGDSTGIRLKPLMISEAFDGTVFQLLWYREYAFGYGRNIIKNDDLELNAGASIKYLQGYGVIDVNISKEPGQTRMSGAVSPVFKVNYGALIENPGTGFKAVGKGMGYEFGLSALVKNRIKLGAAINDIGSIKWKTNVLKAYDDTMNYISSSGFDTYNVFIEGEKIVGNESIFDWEYVPQGTTIKLPTTLRAGAGYYFSKKIEVGMEFVLPLNNFPGSYSAPVASVGADFRVLPWLRLSSGFVAGGNYDFNLPVGISFIFGDGIYEMGFATRDVLTYLGQSRPTLSLSTGFLRFSL